MIIVIEWEGIFLHSLLVICHTSSWNDFNTQSDNSWEEGDVSVAVPKMSVYHWSVNMYSYTLGSQSNL